MRARAVMLLAGLASAGCTLVVDHFTFTSEDAGAIVDGGARPDAAPSDAGERVDAAADVDAGPPPAAPRPTRPYDGFATGSARTAAAPAPRNALRPLFAWTDVPGAASYEIELTSECSTATRADCPFVSAERSSTVEVAWRPALPLEVSSTLPAARRYFWRVRACNGSCSDWSVVRFVDVGRLDDDVDGDGYSDLVLGSPRETVGGLASAGRAYVFFGSEGPSINRVGDGSRTE